MKKIILASKSPRRRQILSDIGMNFEVLESTVDESVISKVLDPKLYVQELAMLKASDVAKKTGKGHIVIGADTVVVSEEKIIGKPHDRVDAIAMLQGLSGKAHKVYTGVAVVDSESMNTATSFGETDVYFDEITQEEIENYVDTYKPFDKAGGYGIQEYAAVFIQKIDGDFFNVVGLPVSVLYKLLKKEFGIII